jgi:hypothetical protein
VETPNRRQITAEGATDVDDAQIVKRIDELVDEEHQLERVHTGSGLSDEDQARLRSLEVQLDQAWDLLRRRRARRHAGLDPDGAVVEPASVVEGYQQ